jgi:hypothetical protein
MLGDVVSLLRFFVSTHPAGHSVVGLMNRITAQHQAMIQAGATAAAVPEPPAPPPLPFEAPAPNPDEPPATA